MYCSHCGKEINDDAAVCIHCGVPVAKARKTAAEDTFNWFALVGFVLAFLFPIAGLVCSIIARKQCEEKGQEGGSLALAGLIISIVSIVIAVIAVVITVLVMVGALAAIGSAI